MNEYRSLQGQKVCFKSHLQSSSAVMELNLSQFGYKLNLLIHVRLLLFVCFGLCIFHNNRLYLSGVLHWRPAVKDSVDYYLLSSKYWQLYEYRRTLRVHPTPAARFRDSNLRLSRTTRTWALRIKMKGLFSARRKCTKIARISTINFYFFQWHRAYQRLSEGFYKSGDSHGGRSGERQV